MNDQMVPSDFANHSMPPVVPVPAASPAEDAANSNSDPSDRPQLKNSGAMARLLMPRHQTPHHLMPHIRRLD
ncbi:hypothetical protein [Rhodopirellula europaea]|uniref:Uncharacterized protein n=1 Tax=Rhodopirellula europaea 6C TaxID=1263867 RepID=M2B1K0_9BACT|nr:hypothetical protein [Rhodopirellula europaea]EMB18797.1 hypothetical protein RE6C_00430 [Rhodopirellula europaea 6C]